MRAATPEWSITVPMRMNIGTGTSTNDDTELSMLRMSWPSPMPPPQNAYTPTRLTTVNAMATVNPINNSSMRPPKKSTR